MFGLLKYAFQAITEGDPVEDFDCGVEELNRFLRERALSNDRRGIGRTFLLHAHQTPGTPFPILGFYTLGMADTDSRMLPRRERQNLPKYPVPVALIGRLAVDRRFQGQGIGDALVQDAFSRILLAADSLGCFGVCVDAKNESAANFYTTFGFKVVKGADEYPKRMFIAISTVRAARQARSG